MTDGPTDIDAAPGPEVVTDPPARRAAYTDFSRDDEDGSGGGTDGSPWPGASVTVARLDGFPVELIELDGRGRTTPREFGASVGRWREVADHDHVLPVVGWGKQPRPWVAVPAGERLSARTGDPGLDEALWIGVCLADALAYAHDAGVVHGAVSPARIHATPTGGFDYPRLDGFGVAHLLREETGPAPHAAPEQLDPQRYGRAGPLADVYGLGVTLYELLTGELPYGTDRDTREAVLESAPVPPTTVAPALPDAVDDLLRGALAKRPVDRYESVAAFRDRLVDLLEAGHVGGGGSSADAPVAFPLFDGDRAEWTAPCPDCGRSVTNTVESFVAHWRDARRCDGPSEAVPDRATCSDEAWTEVVAHAETSIADAPEPGPSRDTSDHPLWAALAREAVVEVGGVAVESDDGTYPWLRYPRRGWRVPCPACGATVYNTRSAMKSHWSDAPSCGPPDDFDTA